MVNICYTKKNNSIISLEVKGHANSAPYGQDLVCAGVSAIVLGGLNALNQNSFKIELNDGEILVEAMNDVSKHDEIVLETIVTQLVELAKDNSKYVKVNGKEM